MNLCPQCGRGEHCGSCPPEDHWVTTVCASPCRARKVAKGGCKCADAQEWSRQLDRLTYADRQWVRDNLNLARA